MSRNTSGSVAMYPNERLRRRLSLNTACFCSVLELRTVDYAEFLFKLALWIDASVRTLAIGIPYFPKSRALCLRVFLPGSTEDRSFKIR